MEERVSRISLGRNLGKSCNGHNQRRRGSSIGSVSAWHSSGPEFDPHVRHILSWRLRHEKIIYGHSPSSTDSRRAVVIYQRKNVHKKLVNCLGSLPRNGVVRVTDRARNVIKCVEGP